MVSSTELADMQNLAAVSVDERRTALQARMDRTLEATGRQYGETLDALGQQSALVEDRIVGLGQRGHLSFNADDGGALFARIQAGPGETIGTRDFTLSPWAATQAGGMLEIPGAYIRGLAYGEAAWQRRLAAQILNEHSQHTPRTRVLMRTVGDKVRGILSDRYRRLNSAQIVRHFLEASRQAGMSLYRAEFDDTQLSIETVLPQVFHVQAGQNRDEFSTWGARLKNSDFGDGALSLSLFTIRVWCRNLMVCESAMRTVHLGSRLASDIQYSERTYKHDTLTQAGAVGDTVKHLLSTDSIRQRIEGIQAAGSESVEPDQAIKLLPKTVTKGEGEALGKVLMAGRPDQVPDGPCTRYKVAQALSAVAQAAETPRRRRDLEEIAGKLLDSK